jgi:hypothetical protein
VTQTSLAPGILIQGRYRLVRLLGQGGMGSVWAAWHQGLQIEVALKFVETGSNRPEEAVARFAREAGAAARIKSPHVVSVMDHGFDEEHQRPFIAMELLHGESLGDRLRREHQLPVGDVADIVRQALRGLGKAHEARVIHHDLKPDNIFLCRDEDLTVKILDFGIAKTSFQMDLTAPSAPQTRTGDILGTPYYMSPEQTMGNRTVDTRSDLYSMGVVAYHCLAGTPPFNSTGLGELLVMINTQPVPSLRAFRSDVPEAIERWVLRSLAKAPDTRFQTAKEMSAALVAALDGVAPASLFPESAWPSSYPSSGSAPSPPVLDPAGGEPTPTAPLPAGVVIRPPDAPGEAPAGLAAPPPVLLAEALATTQMGPEKPAPVGEAGPPFVVREAGAVSGEPLAPPPAPLPATWSRRAPGVIASVLLVAAGAAGLFVLARRPEEARRRATAASRQSEAALPSGSPSSTGKSPDSALQRACDGGDARSCAALGAMFEAGKGAPLDKARALALYKQGCDGGDPEGCASLGVMYEFGRFVGKDEARAMALYEQACDAGGAHGCTSLGNLYESGKGVAKDETRALGLYRKGCDGGHPVACSNLGVAYENGRGVVQDRARAAQLFQKACDGGSASGCHNLGLLHEMGTGMPRDRARAAQLFQQACDGGNARSCASLGALADAGAGVPRDRIRAAALYQKACDGGYPAACTSLGNMYEKGAGVALDKARAALLFQQACDGGNTPGCHDLAGIYERGDGPAQDRSAAVRFYQKACAAGFDPSCKALQRLKQAP